MGRRDKKARTTQRHIRLPSRRVFQLTRIQRLSNQHTEKILAKRQESERSIREGFHSKHQATTHPHLHG